MEINIAGRPGTVPGESRPVARSPARAQSGPAGNLAQGLAPGVESGAEGNRVVVRAVDPLAEHRKANAAHGVRVHLDESTNRLVAEIVNENNEVIRQIPPEELLRITARFREITGMIFDQNV